MTTNFNFKLRVCIILQTSHLGRSPATPRPTVWRHGSLLSPHQDLEPDASLRRLKAGPRLHVPSAHLDCSGWWRARSTQTMTCTLALWVKERVDEPERKQENKVVWFYAETRSHFPFSSVSPSFSKYQVLSFSSSFSTLLSLAVWWGKRVLKQCFGSYWEQHVLYLLRLLIKLTLTKCPKAKANAFCTTELLSWTLFSRALISLPGSNKDLLVIS